MSENEVVSQWLDPDEVRSLAEGLLAKTPVSQIPSHELVFGESFEGFDGEPILSNPVDPPGPPVQPIASEPVNPFHEGQSSPVGSTSPVNQVAPHKVATSQKAKRSSGGLPSLPRALGTFSDWLKKQTPILAAFVCDPKGVVVFDEVGSEKLIKVARSLALASSNKGTGESRGLLQVVIARDRMIEILPLESKEGLSIAGLVVARPLSSEALMMIRRSFKTALSRSLTPGE
jgi:hypothetical protein